MIDHRSYAHNLAVVKFKPEVQAWTGFQAMTSAIPVQCSVYNCDDQSCLHIFFHRSILDISYVHLHSMLCHSKALHKLALVFHGNRCPTVATKWKNERCECSHDTTGKMALIATVGHLLPWNSYASAEYYVHWTYRAELTHDRSHVALIAQLVEHCPGNAKVLSSNSIQSLNIFSGHFASSVMAAFASFILALVY